MEALLARGASTPREAEESRTRAAAAVAAVAAARDGLSYAVLRAPFAGTIAARRANLGDVVAPGTTLIEIEGQGGLELRATVDASVVSRLHAGLSLPALVDGQADALTATVTAVSAAGDPATHRFEVTADLPATPGLRSGLFARLLVPSPGGAPRLLVPSAAVVPRGGLHGLFVISEGTARLRWVALGATNGTSTEVRAGVEAGERVALDPATLVDGAPVTELPEAR
jgi:RND family efflux transporter MFP subunit